MPALFVRMSGEVKCANLFSSVSLGETLCVFSWVGTWLHTCSLGIPCICLGETICVLPGLVLLDGCLGHRKIRVGREPDVGSGSEESLEN